jgi:ubiquinone/menaquinone biosynthesis C-methylase UbiE
MAHRVCPWWLGYLLASPLQRLIANPRKLLAPYVHEGMTVLEPGPGMGFFTLELARLVGQSGRVVALDIQSKMLDGLKRRLAKARLLERVNIHLVQPNSMGLAELAGPVDFALAFAVVHEMPSASSFFAELYRALKPGGSLLLAEPSGHVKAALWDAELEAASQAGFIVAGRPRIRRSQTALLKKLEAQTRPI